MAKSSKSSSRKKNSSAEQKDTVVDAEVLNDADTAAVEADASAAIETAKEAVEEHEPMDSEVEDVLEDVTQPDEVADPSEADAEPQVTDQEEPEPPQTEPAPLVSEQPAAGGLFPSVLGGVIAGALGFGAAMLIFPDGWREQDNSVVTNLQAGLAEQKENLSELTTSVGDLGTTVEELGGKLDGGLETLKSEIAERAGVVTQLGERLDRLSEGDGKVALPDDVQILLNAQKEKIAALSEEVAGMAATAKAQMQAAVDQQETAEQAEARVKARGAMQNIRLALVSGEPFADALQDVAPAVDVPDGLQAVAAEGVPTQAEIQQAYPAAARAALSKAIREEAGTDTQSRVILFFKDQLGARSLTPQEGDSADAVLSRAEAAVKAEDIATALSEIENLPDAAKAEFADWQATASARVAAVDGFETVSSALNGN